MILQGKAILPEWSDVDVISRLLPKACSQIYFQDSSLVYIDKHAFHRRIYKHYILDGYWYLCIIRMSFCIVVHIIYNYNVFGRLLNE